MAAAQGEGQRQRLGEGILNSLPYDAPVHARFWYGFNRGLVFALFAAVAVALGPIDYPWPIETSPSVGEVAGRSAMYIAGFWLFFLLRPVHKSLVGTMLAAVIAVCPFMFRRYILPAVFSSTTLSTTVGHQALEAVVLGSGLGLLFWFVFWRDSFWS